MASHRFNFSFCDLNMYVPEGAILDRIRYVQYHFRDRISFNTRTLSLKAAALTSKKQGTLDCCGKSSFLSFRVSACQ